MKMMVYNVFCRWKAAKNYYNILLDLLNVIE